MSGSTTPQSRSFSDPAGYGARFVAFDQFNPTLGTLVGIDVGITASVAGSLSVESLEAAPVSISYTAGATVSAYTPGGTLLARQVAAGSNTVALAAFDGSGDFAGTLGASFTTAGAAGPTAVSLGGAPTGTTDGTPFIGTGTVALPVGDFATNAISGGANMRVLASAAVGATVTLAYDYTPVAPSGGGTGGSGVVSIIVYPPPYFILVPVTTAAQVFTFAAGTTGWTSQFAVAQFNPSLGQLAAVQLRVVGTLSASAAVENHAAAAGSVQVSQGVNTAVSLGGGAALDIAQTSVSRALSLGAADGSDDFAGPGGARDSGVAATGARGASLAGQAQLAAFIGTGTVSLSIATQGYGSILGPSSFLATLTAQSGATVEVAYTYLVDPSAAAVLVTTAGSGGSQVVGAQAYGGPVNNVKNQFIDITPNNVTVAATTDNWFIRTGAGDDAIAARGGTNVIDGGGGSNFMSGGFGRDIFFIDGRDAARDVWSTITNFASGDAVTIWGVTASNRAFNWYDNEGAAGATGLTLHATEVGAPILSLTLAGYGTADLTRGILTTSFGTVDGVSYLYVHAT